MAVKARVDRLTIKLAGAEVPSILSLPISERRVPAVLLLHGYSSSKERLASTMGRALAAREIIEWEAIADAARQTRSDDIA